MKRLFKKKEIVVVAPINATCYPIDQVNDPVFSSKMMGEGVAFNDFRSNIFCAPSDGVISVIAETLHAFVITSTNGAEILTHIGLDTVSLKGAGFKQLAKQGERVVKGTPIIEVDMDFMKDKGMDLMTPMVIINGANYQYKINMEINTVTQGESVVITFL